MTGYLDAYSEVEKTVDVTVERIGCILLWRHMIQKINEVNVIDNCYYFKLKEDEINKQFSPYENFEL